MNFLKFIEDKHSKKEYLFSQGTLKFDETVVLLSWLNEELSEVFDAQMNDYEIIEEVADCIIVMNLLYFHHYHTAIRINGSWLSTTNHKGHFLDIFLNVIRSTSHMIRGRTPINSMTLDSHFMKVKILLSIAMSLSDSFHTSDVVRKLKVCQTFGAYKSANRSVKHSNGSTAEAARFRDHLMSMRHLVRDDVFTDLITS